MKIAEFINTGFKAYVGYDNHRKLPHLMDGLKLTERKVLYAFINYIGTGSIVCDKAGMRAAEVTKYHHGATSMISVLVGMNQDFPGANNLPLFTKSGQFGTKLNHEASSERYISTQLNDTYKKLFDSNDEHILIAQEDQGEKIEPKYYLPRLPLLLLNGSEGVGNGYSSTILSYSVESVQKAVLQVLKNGRVQDQLVPYLKGFSGKIEKNPTTGQVTFTGKIEKLGANKLLITELPPNLQLHQYKVVLNKLIEDKIIKDYDNESTEDQWRFIIDCPRSTTDFSQEKLLATFKLISRTTENLVAWLPNGKLKKFKSVEELVEEWVKLRLEHYELRKKDMLTRIADDIAWLTLKRDFINFWNDKAVELIKCNKQQLQAELYDWNGGLTEDLLNRLLSIRISNLGREEVFELESDIDKLRNRMNSILSTGADTMMKEEVKSIKM